MTAAALIFPVPRKRCRDWDGAGGQQAGRGHTQTSEPYNQAAAAVAVVLLPGLNTT